MIFARIVWFLTFWILTTLPLQLVRLILNPKNADIFANGQIHPGAAAMAVALIIYLPFSFALAARGSGQFQKPLYPQGQ